MGVGLHGKSTRTSEKAEIKRDYYHMVINGERVESSTRKLLMLIILQLVKLLLRLQKLQKKMQKGSRCST